MQTSSAANLGFDYTATERAWKSTLLQGDVYAPICMHMHGLLACSNVLPVSIQPCSPQTLHPVLVKSQDTAAHGTVCCWHSLLLASVCHHSPSSPQQGGEMYACQALGCLGVAPQSYV